jgi:DnaJ-class molecular chaperone
MADGYKLWRICLACAGSGHTGKLIEGDPGQPPTNETCTLCNGSGYIFFGWCSVDTFTLPANLPEPD